MRGLVGEELLTGWERSRELPEQEAALALLEIACPERPAEEWAWLPLAERDALLLELRGLTLGRRMEGYAVCPECGAQLEFAVDAGELARGLRAQITEDEEDPGGFAMRAANTLDLLAAGATEDEEEARAILLARATGADNGAMEGADSGRWAANWLASQPAPVAALLRGRFERMNAEAEVRVQLECAACRSRPVLDLDVARFLLREIGVAARRLMAEIHALAHAYGWSEGSIAAMSSVRRAAYMEMLGS
jgi:hypothetical protein